MSCDEATLTLFFSNVHNGPLRQRIQRDNNDEVEWFLKHTKPQYDIFSFPPKRPKKSSDSLEFPNFDNYLQTTTIA